MAKVLISSIGTGQKKEGSYEKASYKIDDKLYETSFIADALKQHLEIDVLYLVGTRKSIWDEAYISFGGNDANYHETLYEQKEKGEITDHSLEQLNKLLDKDSKCVVIDYGLNEEELWSNFEKFLEISNHIKDGDELYLDITHSFRSLSLMSFVMTQFASSISEKNFTIKGVFYGMFEYRFENNGVTPIVDIKLLLEIQEWIKAIDAIKKYSDFDLLVTLLENEEDIEKEVKNTFVQLNNTLNIANLSAFELFIKTASKKINRLKQSNNKIVVLLAPYIVTLVEQLHCEKKSHFQFNLSKWFYKNKNYAFAYLALYEAVISKSCEFKEYDVNDHLKREEAKKSIGYDKYGQYFYTKHENSISQIRNAIAHQNNDRKDWVTQDIKRLENFLEIFETYIYE